MISSALSDPYRVLEHVCTFRKEIKEEVCGDVSRFLVIHEIFLPTIAGELFRGFKTSGSQIFQVYELHILVVVYRDTNIDTVADFQCFSFRGNKYISVVAFLLDKELLLHGNTSRMASNFIEFSRNIAGINLPSLA